MNETKDRAEKWLTKRHRSRKLASILLPAMVIAGCAGLSGGSQSPEQRVEQRAQAHLDALLNWELDKAMQYTTPTYRDKATRNDYGAKFGGAKNWTKGHVKAVACEGKRCDVTIVIDYQVSHPRFSRIKETRPLEQVWIKVDREWYIYHK